MDTTTLEIDLIATAMESPDAYDEASGIVSPNDMSNHNNRQIWAAIGTLKDMNRSFDASSMKAFLEETGRDRLVEPLAQIAKNGVFSTRNMASKAKRIREVSVIRLLRQAGARITELAETHCGRDLTELLGEAEDVLSTVVAGNLADDIPVYDGVQLMRDLWADVERAASNPGISGISTGMASLDEKTDGLQKGDMIIVAGPPSMGKTAFAVNLVQNSLMAITLPVVVFSMEMPALDISRRMLSTQANVQYTRIKRGTVEQFEIEKMLVGARHLQNPLLKICAASALTPAKMRAVLKRIAREYGGIAMAMVDYVQLMDANKSKPSRQEEVASISRDLKRMAMEFKMPFLVLSQLTKDVEKFKRKPNNGDLRETGQLAQDADLIMFVHRQEKYDDEPKAENMGKAEIIVSKSRNSEIGSVLVGYDGPTFKFFDMAGVKSW